MVVAPSPPSPPPSVVPGLAHVPGSPATQAALETQQIFNLIDSYLPFEACLHYQLLPLRVDRDRMYLGMVDPHDRTALEYAVRMAQYWNYRLIPNPIAHARLNTILSAYLNFMQLQGPSAYQDKIRLASQIAKNDKRPQPKPKNQNPASTPRSISLPPPSTKPMLVINDETVLLDESAMMTIEAHESSVIPLSGTVDPHFALPVPGDRPTSSPSSSSSPSRLAAPTVTPVTAPIAPAPVTAPVTAPIAPVTAPIVAPILSPIAPAPVTAPIAPPVAAPQPNQTPQQRLDQLGKTTLHLTRQLRQAMDALQDYGTAHPVEAQQRQQAIVAIGRDLSQINQDFKTLLRAIAAQKVS